MNGKTIRKIERAPKLPELSKESGRKKVAAYARVSTDREEQQTSLEAQVSYYSEKIKVHPGWEFVEVYSDDGISGLSTRKRDGFNRMIADCMDGKIDLILTKSISRFARNTVDTISVLRDLKARNIGVFFEKENILSTDSKGEFVLTLMSSFAQEESRSISENVTWGKRRYFAEGRAGIPYSSFLGYDKGPVKCSMVINEGQAKIVRLIYRLCLQGNSCYAIALAMMALQIPAPEGGEKWSQSTIQSILTNEKYKGDALLQKTYTVDFLTKKKKVNNGELQKYYVENDHEAIISLQLFDYVQEIMRGRFELGHRYSGITPFNGKLICGECGGSYGPRPWHSTTYNYRVWQCPSKGRKGPKCRSTNLYDNLLHYSIHDIAMEIVRKRGILTVMSSMILPQLSTERAEAVRKWVSEFCSRNIWLLQSDEDDLIFIIRKIVVDRDRKAQVFLIDGSSMQYTFPDYKPSVHLREMRGQRGSEE